jgi:hypothetical protein
MALACRPDSPADDEAVWALPLTTVGWEAPNPLLGVIHILCSVESRMRRCVCTPCAPNSLIRNAQAKSIVAQISLLELPST